MSKPKENLFYFDQQEEDTPQVLQTVSTRLSPNKTVTKQFHKIEDINQLAKNFFQRDNNIDERAKDIIITNSARKKISRHTRLSIPAMDAESQKTEVKHSLNNYVIQNQEVIKGKLSGFTAQSKDDLEEIQLEGKNIKSKGKKVKPLEEFQQILMNIQVIEKLQQKVQHKQQKIVRFEEIVERQEQKREKSESDDENLQTHNQQQQENDQDERQDDLHYQTPIKIKFFEIVDRKTFLTAPIQKGKVLECTLRRDKSGFNHFFPQYSLYTTDGIKYLMTSKKRSGNATSNYLISLDKNDLSTKGNNYIGKLRSNWVGTQFIGYDSGDNPDKVQAGKKQRIQLCEIYYESNFFGSKGPRVMNVYVPKDAEPSKQKSTLKQIFNKTGQGIHLINKPPRWNPDTKTFVLNFNNRVDKPSVKNFILIDKSAPSQNNNHYSLLFGRISQDVFNLDVKYPLSPLQAFQIVLSSFDYKLACE